MTNKIIEAAREAGIEFQQHTGITGRVRATTCGSQPVEKMERFYAIARDEALEDAAKAVKSLTAEIRFQAIEHYKFADAAEKTILALKEQDAAIASGKAEN